MYDEAVTESILATVDDSTMIDFDIGGPWTTPINLSLLLPFGSAVNPNAGAVGRCNVDWAVERRIIDPGNHRQIDALRRCHFEQLAALVHRKSSADELELITNAFTAIFVVDDLLDSAVSDIGVSEELSSHMTGFLLAALSDEPLPVLHPDLPCREQIIALANGFTEVTLRLRTIISRPRAHIYFDEMRQYFRGCVMESRSRRLPKSDFLDYEGVRLRCSAVFAAMEFGALVDGVDLPPELRSDPDMQAMRKATNLCVSYVNDLFSYAKEEANGEFSNLVKMHRLVYDMDLRTAMRASAAVIDVHVANYLEAEQRFLARVPRTPEVDGYRELMRSWMRGNFDWYDGRTDRYRDYLSTASGEWAQVSAQVP